MDITTKEIEQLEYALFEEEVRLKREHIELKKELKLLSEKLLKHSYQVINLI